MSWQPIETAPKDGTEILLFRDADVYEGEPVEARVTSGAWIEWAETTDEYHGTTGEYLGRSVQDAGASWCSWDGGFRENATPTHWMPLPPPPTIEAKPMTQRQQYAVVPVAGSDAIWDAMSRANDLWPPAQCDNGREARMSYAKPRYDAALKAAPPPPEQVLTQDEVEQIYHAWQNTAGHAGEFDLIRLAERAVLHNLGAKNGE